MADMTGWDMASWEGLRRRRINEHHAAPTPRQTSTDVGGAVVAHTGLAVVGDEVHPAGEELKRRETADARERAIVR